MATDTQEVEQIIAQVQRLSPQERVRLIQRVAELLLPTDQKSVPRYLVYGEFKGENMSTEDDFRIAEWHPTEEELDGT